MDTGNTINQSDMKSIWKSYSAGSNFPSLPGDVTTDVVIIGGGITGITTAQLLKEAGFSVVVAEQYSVGGGSTGGSTGNLYISVEEGFDTLKSKYNAETLNTVLSARRDAMELVAQNVQRYKIDCDFKPQTWYLYSSNEENKSKVEKEFKAAVDAGANAVEVQPGELPFPVVNGFKIDGQANFNPLRYVQQLAKAIHDDKCRIYENTPVIDIEDEHEDSIKIKTHQGTIHAKYIVHATHTPKGVFLDFHSLLGTYREYGVAVKLASGNYPQGIMWGYYNMKERFSVRSYEHNGEKYVMAIGKTHEVGQKENNTENVQGVEDFLRKYFDVAEVTNRWGGQNYKPADGLPYIGRARSGTNLFIATGFSTDGLTYGTLSAIIIRDQLTGKETEYTKTFDATRHNPMKAAGKFIKENAINAAVTFKDYVLFKDSKLAEIPAGEGRVVEVDGKKVAVYNDTQGGMKACSAICTHLGCVVHFNKAEKSWDCPCHASRFTTDGEIIEGPALTPLEKVNIQENTNNNN
jgi:glycine/D-amino acid oxidase-like deaminating enzyme/nitrite reductase/ring-hydroxylating ferredoxin subunit